MADARAQAPRRSSSWDWAHPGAKEYLTVGGVALGLFLIYFWYKQKQASSTSSTGSTTGTSTATPSSTTPGGSSALSSNAAGTSPTGLSLTQFLATMTNQQSSATAPAPAATATATAPAANVNGAVSGLTASNVTAHSALIKWNPVTGATGYAVRQVTPATNATAVENVTATQFAPNNLNPSTAYTFYVSAEPSTTGHGAVTFTTPAA